MTISSDRELVSILPSRPLQDPHLDKEPDSDVHRLSIRGKEILLVGTAHISRDSVDTVQRVIEEERPDTVCLELDQQRYQSLVEPDRWKSLDLVQVIRKGQGAYLLANLALSAFQKKMGLQTGVKPGAELLAAAQTADRCGIEVRLIDRDIRTTLLRAWRKTGLWKKMNLLAALFAGVFETQQVDEEQLARLRQTDTLTAMLDEMGEIMPPVKTILVDERDHYMAHQILESAGEKIVAVVGAAHVPGIIRRLGEENLPDPSELTIIPDKPLYSKILPWAFPVIVLALFVVGFFFADPRKLTDAALAWVLANGLFAALGTVAALGHPLTVISAFIAAPITSLNPTIGAGFVTGLVQAFVAAPTVNDLENVNQDLASLPGWWRNRMTRVLLVFLFSSLGSIAGTLLAFRWLAELI
ncbi:MAG: TraB/GumN family protein [Syntrophotaleaceae bacterium]